MTDILSFKKIIENLNLSNNKLLINKWMTENTIIKYIFHHELNNNIQQIYFNENNYINNLFGIDKINRKKKFFKLFQELCESGILYYRKIENIDYYRFHNINEKLENSNNYYTNFSTLTVTSKRSKDDSNLSLVNIKKHTT